MKIQQTPGTKYQPLADRSNLAQLMRAGPWINALAQRYVFSLIFSSERRYAGVS